MNPKDLKYTKEHEWVRVDGANAVIGITEFAQKELGDIVFVDLPKVGDQFKQMANFAVVESAKAVSDIYCPITGKVTDANKELESEPELVNQDPYGKGWIATIEISNPSELDQLMTAQEYEEIIKK